MVLCRACLTLETNMIPMDTAFIKSFNLLTGLSITMSNNLLYACKTCNDAVKFFIDFRKRCIESDLSFQEMLISVTVQEIKQENEAKLEKDCIYSTVKEEPTDTKLNKTQNNDDKYGSDREYACVTTKSEAIPKRKRNLNIKDKIIREKRMKRNKINSNETGKNTDLNIHCGLCYSKFADKKELKKHLEHHKSLFNTQGTCGLCNERFLNLPHMLGHRLEHVPEEQRICHICSKKFIASSSTCLEFHYMRVHGMAEKDAQIQCKQCASSYITSRKLIRHVRDCHTAPRFECQLCNRSFRNKTLLNVHNKMQHTDGKQFKCELCSFTSKYPNSLMLHTRRKHTSNTFNCKACYRVFLDEPSLTHHVTDVCKHHTRVVCSVCGHTVQKVSLKRHMMSHSDEYPFKCDKCPAKYKYRTGFKDHSDKHKGAMKFHCNLCSKSFCIKSALQSHRRTHAGDKPFICDICKIGFKRRYNLKAHLNTHPWSSVSEHGDEKKINS